MTRRGSRSSAPRSRARTAPARTPPARPAAGAAEARTVVAARRARGLQQNQAAERHRRPCAAAAAGTAAARSAHDAAGRLPSAPRLRDDAGARAPRTPSKRHKIRGRNELHASRTRRRRCPSATEAHKPRHASRLPPNCRRCRRAAAVVCLDRLSVGGRVHSRLRRCLFPPFFRLLLLPLLLLTSLLCVWDKGVHANAGVVPEGLRAIPPLSARRRAALMRGSVPKLVARLSSVYTIDICTCLSPGTEKTSSDTASKDVVVVCFHRAGVVRFLLAGSGRPGGGLPVRLKSVIESKIVKYVKNVKVVLSCFLLLQKRRCFTPASTNSGCIDASWPVEQIFAQCAHCLGPLRTDRLEKPLGYVAVAQSKCGTRRCRAEYVPAREQHKERSTETASKRDGPDLASQSESTLIDLTMGMHVRCSVTSPNLKPTPPNVFSLRPTSKTSAAARAEMEPMEISQAVDRRRPAVRADREDEKEPDDHRPEPKSPASAFPARIAFILLSERTAPMPTDSLPLEGPPSPLSNDKDPHPIVAPPAQSTSLRFFLTNRVVFVLSYILSTDSNEMSTLLRVRMLNNMSVRLR